MDTQDSENYLITSEAGIQAAVVSNVNLVVSIRDNFDNVPAADKKKNDVIIVTALGINF